jgi:hypothetical protein
MKRNQGLAFTGSSAAVRFGGLALVLFGLGLLLIQASRKYGSERG